jgi:hypothetical protein
MEERVAEGEDHELMAARRSRRQMEDDGECRWCVWGGGGGRSDDYGAEEL